ncbi:MAG: hypothetical protein RLZZ61_738 [Pseudomonadota bacterium]
MKTRTFTLAAVFFLAACQQPAADESAATPEAAADATASYNAAQKAYAAANDKMHSGMVNINADADIAFMQGMIPHHVGAVEMAKVALEHGKNPEVRALAQKVIAAQEAEIKDMQAWLDKKGATTEKPLTAADHAAMGH